MPTAENNHVINYNLKLKNYLMMNSTIHMFSAGAFTFLIQTLLGRPLDRLCTNYLGQKRGQYAQIGLYIFIFVYGMGRLNNAQRLNVNHLVNPRDINGEIMLNLCMKYFPKRVNTDLYRKILMEKYENQILRINDMEYHIFHRPEPYKLTNQNAIANYAQEIQGQQSPQLQQPQQQLSIPGMPVMAPQNLPQEAPQVQNPLQTRPTHQDQHLNRLIAQSNLQQQPTPEQLAQIGKNEQADLAHLQAARKRILDQMREQQNQSPYLNTNPVFAQPTGTQAQSPYFLTAQEIAKDTSQQQLSATQSMYGLLPPQQPQQPTYRYMGHYQNVAQQAKRDTS